MKESRGKERLDVLMVQKGLADTRAYAQRLIRAGTVLVGTDRVDKPGTMVAVDAPLRCTVAERRYVSRGGYKLAAALDGFGLDVREWDVADLGASTGGFVDCLLQRGARRVVAVDVGRGLLDSSLVHDPRVTLLERCNARHLTLEQLGAPVRMVTMDLSFISLLKVLPAALGLLTSRGSIVALIKPQFEAGRGQVPRGGVVRDPAIHRQVLRELRDKTPPLGLSLQGALVSPIAGAKGNREFLGWFVPGATPLDDAALEAAVAAAQQPPANPEQPKEQACANDDRS